MSFINIAATLPKVTKTIKIKVDLIFVKHQFCFKTIQSSRKKIQKLAIFAEDLIPVRKEIVEIYLLVIIIIIIINISIIFIIIIAIILIIN